MTKPARLLAPALLLIASAGLAQTDSPFPRIRSIVIEHKSVFGPEERLDDIPHVPDLTFIFHLANLLHIDTKEEVIRRELLVHEGEPADPALIAESERNLRALPYIRRVKILVSPAPEGQVDLHVLAQDTWTTQPRASFALGGGSHRSSLRDRRGATSSATGRRFACSTAMESTATRRSSGTATRGCSAAAGSHPALTRTRATGTWQRDSLVPVLFARDAVVGQRRLFGSPRARQGIRSLRNRDRELPARAGFHRATVRRSPEHAVRF